MNIAVIGAGVAGLTCALALAERGAEVAVFERSNELGIDSCSWLAGGMLAPWCELESADELVALLGAEALDYWTARFPGTVGNGSIVVARPRDMTELKQFSKYTRNFTWLDDSTLSALEPELGGRFSKALYFPHEGHLEPRAALHALAERLEWLGVTIHFGCDAIANPPDSSIVVDCRGLAARDVWGDLRGVKGEMIVVQSADVTLSRPVRLLHPRYPLYVVPRGHGLFMIGATVVESDGPARVTARAILELLGGACALHPAFAEAEVVELSTGVRPAFPNNLPRIRRAGRTIHVNGLFRHGFLLAPALAWRVASVILDRAFFPEVMDENQVQRRSA